MKIQRMTVPTLVLAAIALLLATRPVSAQIIGPGNQNPQQPSNRLPRAGQNTGLNNDPTDFGSGRSSGSMQEHMAIARNDERQKRLVLDTEKLYTLVTQLKADVDKSDKYMLSLDVVRRSEEIEKLARSIKDRAKN